MTEQNWIKSLDRETPPPDIDVVADVLRTIRLRQSAAPEPSFAWPALFATLAGSTAVLIAFQTVTSLQDPLSTFLDSFKLVLQ